MEGRIKGQYYWGLQCIVLTVLYGDEIFQTQFKLFSYSPDSGNLRCPAGAISNLTSLHAEYSTNGIVYQRHLAYMSATN